MTIRIVAFLALGWVVASLGRAQETASAGTRPTPADNESAPSPSLARWQQAMALLTAAEHGDTGNRAQLQSLVASVKADPALSEHARFVVASRARGLAIRETPHLMRAGRLAAYEQSARDMIAAYPDQPEPYEALLALANDQPDAAAGAKLAQELLAMAGSPAAVKAGAQRRLDRAAMVGKPAPAVIGSREGDSINLAQFQGQVVVLYVWTAAGKHSAQWVQKLLAHRKTGAVFVGINFDRDRERARAKAAEVAPGMPHLYDPAGLAGPAAAELNISRVPSVYLIGRAGVVRSVRGRKDFAQQLAALLAGKGGQS